MRNSKLAAAMAKIAFAKYGMSKARYKLIRRQVAKKLAEEVMEP